MGHPVWKILNKEKYVEEFVPQAEQMYNFIEELVNTAGYARSSKTGNTVSAMKEFFDLWNEYSSETFGILNNLVNKI